MSPTLLRLSVAFQRWFAWWLRELKCLVPARLAEILAGERNRLVIDVEPTQLVVRHRVGDQVRELARIAIPETGLPQRPSTLARLGDDASLTTIVRLAPEVAVTKLVQLPDTAAANLRQILEHQLERHTPVAPAQLYFDYAVTAHDQAQRRVAVELVMVMRSTVDAVGELMRDWGLAPRAIGLIEQVGWGTRFDFAPRRDTENLARARRRRLVLAALVIVLLGSAAYATLEHAQREADALATAVAETKAQALAAARLRSEIAKRIEQRDFLALKRQETLRLQALTAITSALGDDTWLTDLQLAGAKVRASGYSQAASALIPLLQQRAGFANPRFESPVTRAVTGGGERFDLSVELGVLPRAGQP
jgi:general secretion pathway protein L